MKNLGEFHLPLVTSELALNILLHSTILFTVLSILFTQFISNVTSNAINREIEHIINNDIGEIHDEIKNIFDEQTNNEINKERRKILKNEFKTMTKTENYDYYINLFSKNDVVRQSINNQVFFYIKIVAVLLIIFLIFFIFYSVKTETITQSTVRHIILENVITFIFIGAFEYLFFINVAFKYIPTKPSLLTKSLVDSLKSKLSSK